MSSPGSKKNQQVLDRFLEEQHEGTGEWADSDVSESERDNLLGNMESLAAAQQQRSSATAAQQQRDRAAPLHVVFVIDTSKSMKCKDVRGESRLDAVFDACIQFAEANVHSQMSLITFGSAATTWFRGVSAGDSCALLLRTCHKKIKPKGETRFLAAFQEIYRVMDSADGNDVRVLFLTDGKPGDPLQDRTPEALRTVLLRTPRVRCLRRFVLYTIGFGSSAENFQEYLKPLSDATGGMHLVSSLSQVDLSQVFTSVSTSIALSRSSSPQFKNTQDPLAIPFSCSSAAELWTKRCTISRIRVSKKTSSSVEEIKASEVLARVEQFPFAHGGMRTVYHMWDDWNGKDQRLVAKRLLDKDIASKDDMLHFCKSLAVANSFAESFYSPGTLDKRPLAESDPKIRFVPCYMYCCRSGEGVENYFLGEHYLDGNFVKFNSNNGYVNELAEHCEFMQAFSHYTFYKSSGRYMVVDIQGVVDETEQEQLPGPSSLGSRMLAWASGGHLGPGAARGSVWLTDPQVLSADRSFGPGDLGVDGFHAFFESHKCGQICKDLGLEDMQQMLNKVKSKRRQCIICMDALREVLMQPCGHFLTCQACAEELMRRSGSCPNCRLKMTGWMPGTASATYTRNVCRR